MLVCRSYRFPHLVLVLLIFVLLSVFFCHLASHLSSPFSLWFSTTKTLDVLCNLLICSFVCSQCSPIHLLCIASFARVLIDLLAPLIHSFPCSLENECLEAGTFGCAVPSIRSHHSLIRFAHVFHCIHLFHFSLTPSLLRESE